MYCPKCGKETEQSGIFCQSCGANLKDLKETAPKTFPEETGRPDKNRKIFRPRRSFSWRTG